MQNIVINLVFSVVLLMFMIYPSIRIVDFLKAKIDMSDRFYNISTVILTIILSLIVGTLINIL